MKIARWKRKMQTHLINATLISFPIDSHFELFMIRGLSNQMTKNSFKKKFFFVEKVICLDPTSRIEASLRSVTCPFHPCLMDYGSTFFVLLDSPEHFHHLLRWQFDSPEHFKHPDLLEK